MYFLVLTIAIIVMFGQAFQIREANGIPKCFPELTGDLSDGSLHLTCQVRFCNSEVLFKEWRFEGDTLLCTQMAQVAINWWQCTIRHDPAEGNYQCLIQGPDGRQITSNPYKHPSTQGDNSALIYGITFGILVPVTVAVLAYMVYLCFKYHQLEQGEMFHPTATGLRRTPTAASHVVIFKRKKQNIYVPFPPK